MMSILHYLCMMVSQSVLFTELLFLVILSKHSKRVMGLDGPKPAKTRGKKASGSHSNSILVAFFHQILFISCRQYIDLSLIFYCKFPKKKVFSKKIVFFNFSVALLLFRPDVYFLIKMIWNVMKRHAVAAIIWMSGRSSSHVEDVFIVGHKNMNSCSFADL